MNIEDYKRKFAGLRVNVAHGRASPHKICMLLALLDLARSGSLKQNRIPYDVALLDRYQQYFHAVKTGSDHPNPRLAMQRMWPKREVLEWRKHVLF